MKRSLLFLIVVALLGWLLTPFLKSLGVAIILAMALSPWQRWGEKAIGGIVSAGLLTASVTLIVVAPLLVMGYYGVMGVIQWGSHWDTLARTDWFQSSSLSSSSTLHSLITYGEQHFKELLGSLAGWIGSQTGSLLKGFGGFLSSLGLTLIFLFFILLYRRPLLKAIVPAIPLGLPIKKKVLQGLITSSSVIVYTFVGVMVAQGIAFGVLMLFFEGHDPWLLGMMAGVSAMIPIVGTALVWVPVAVSEFFAGHVMNAMIISLYSWAVMAFFIDNIVKLMILNGVNRWVASHQDDRIHEGLLFLGLVGGLTTLGVEGIFIGPAIITVAVILLRHQRRLG